MKTLRQLFALLAVGAALSTSAFAADPKDSITIVELDPNSPKKPIAQVDASSPENIAIISKAFSDAEKIKDEERTHIGRNASYVQIEIRFHGQTITLASLHSIYEGKLPVVATADAYPGLEALGARTLADVIKEQPQSYRYFRETFDSIYAATKKAADSKDSSPAK
jgi:hypothetical protein